MGVTTIQQSQSPNKQSSKELPHGGRRGSRSGSSSAATVSSPPTNGQSTTKRSSPPSKFTSQLRKLRKRSSTNNNNQTSSSNSTGRHEKKMKRDDGETAGTKQKSRDLSPEHKRKHLKMDNKSIEEESSRSQKAKEKREDGANKEDKSDKEKDLKNNSSTNSSTSSKNSSSSNNNTENKGNSSSSSNLKNRPPVKLTVKFNKSEGGSKKPCQVQVVNSSLSVLPAISSSTSTASEEKVENNFPSISNSSPSKDTSAGTSISKSEKGKFKIFLNCLRYLNLYTLSLGWHINTIYIFRKRSSCSCKWS